MIAVDTNILVYAHRAESPHYRKAYDCIESLAAGRETWAIPWPCLHEFLAVVTNPRSFRPATSLDDALEQVDVWLSSPNLVLLEETSAHWASLTGALRNGRIVGGMVHDARIAALCFEHGVRELWTADRDFARFPGLATFNPLAETSDHIHETPPAYAAIRRARAAGRRRALADPRVGPGS